MSSTKGLVERFTDGEKVIVAEGYLMELERRGYNRNGSFVPTVVLDYPEQVEVLTREFVHAGSDICQAFTYYAHKKKLKDMGRELEFDKLNRTAHEIAKKVARETGTLFCSGFGTTNVFDPKKPETFKQCEDLFRDQISLSAEYGVDYVVLETLWDYGEASIALKICNEFKIPTVITLVPVEPKAEKLKTFDGYDMVDALKRLQSEGAVCVGLNCARGPETMIPIIKDLRNEITGPLACISIGYRTTEDQKTWYRLRHPGTGKSSFPDDLGAHYLGQSDVEWYGAQLKEIGVEYVGFCCGNSASYTRTLAMSLGRSPPAAKFASDFKQKSMIKGEETLYSDRYSQEFGRFAGF